MHKVVYRPKPGGAFVSPQLAPGQVIEVSHAEAEHLISTGAFEAFNPKPVEEQAEPETAGDKPARSRKETKNG